MMGYKTRASPLMIIISCSLVLVSLQLSSAAYPPVKDKHSALLCKWCRCTYDPSSWMVQAYPAGTTPLPDSDSLLVNCSGTSASPFAGLYEWPDVPNHHHDETPEEENDDLPVVPATRADFSFCGLAGELRKMPSVPLRRLRELSLAKNSISWIESNALSGLPALELLDLSGNKLSKVSADALPESLNTATSSNILDLRLSHNELLNVPWEALLRLPLLERLDVGHNLIGSVEEGYNGLASDLIFANIKVLNLTYNKLTDFSIAVAERFPGLLELDLSWNSMETIPGALIKGGMPREGAPPQTPNANNATRSIGNTCLQNLRLLRLDGNPIKVLPAVGFSGAPSLKWLSVSFTDTLQVVDANAFGMLMQLEILHLSRNPHLSSLPKEGFFQGMRKTERWTIKEVDLSYNSLQFLRDDFLPWDEIKRVDLQGNPWNCNCSLQWMLDSLMPDIYKKDSELLFDLRCAKPNWLKGRRFVHWLGHTEGVYCGGRKMSALRQEEENEVEVVALGMNTGMLTAVVAIAVLCLGLMVAAVVLQRRVTRKEKDLRTRQFRCRNPRY